MLPCEVRNRSERRARPLRSRKLQPLLIPYTVRERSNKKPTIFCLSPTRQSRVLLKVVIQACASKAGVRRRSTTTPSWSSSLLCRLRIIPRFNTSGESNLPLRKLALLAVTRGRYPHANHSISENHPGLERFACKLLTGFVLAGRIGS